MSAVLNDPRSGRTLDQFEAEFDRLAAGRGDQVVIPKVSADEVRTALGLPGLVKREWQKLIRLDPAALNGLKPSVAVNLADALATVRYVAANLKFQQTLFSNYPPPPELDRVQAAGDELEEFVEMILTRWNTLDDLYELIADTFELPEVLTVGPIPEHMRPPASWYQEATDPTKPATV